MRLIFSFVLIIWTVSSSAKSLCEVYTWMACPDAFAASRSNTSASLPLNSAAAPTNPASMSTERGLGLEVLRLRSYYDVSIISGTGVIGSSLSISNNEGTFFGGRPPENLVKYDDRKADDKKYKSPKFTSLFAVKLLGGKNKNSFRLNLGGMGQYNKDTKGISGGLGLSAALGPVSMGVARLKNDHYDLINLEEEEYYSNSFTLGIKIASMAFDWTYIKNNANNWSRIRILTATLFTKKFMFTYGKRQEESIFPFSSAELNSNGEISVIKNLEYFLGLQYAVKKSVIIGVFSNYYLLDSLSLGLTIFI